MNSNIQPKGQANNSIALLKSTLSAPSVQEQFRNALGEHKDAFVASLIDLYTGDKSLQECAPAALITEALRAATLRLPLNKALGFAYIVVYKNSRKEVDAHGKEHWVKVPTPTFIPGYKGYIQMAMRTGQYRTINADLVYEGELRRGNKLTGEILLDGTRTSDKVIGYFCYFELLNGFSKTLYMTVQEMAQYAKRYSPSIGKETTEEKLIAKAQETTPGKSVGWEGNFNDMALKTVVRRLISKYGYLSVEMQGAVASDVQADTAMTARNSAVADTATDTINIDTVEYTDTSSDTAVDTDTGEVSAQAAQEQQPQPEY